MKWKNREPNNEPQKTPKSRDADCVIFKNNQFEDANCDDDYKVICERGETFRWGYSSKLGKDAREDRNEKDSKTFLERGQKCRNPTKILA